MQVVISKADGGGGPLIMLQIAIIFLHHTNNINLDKKRKILSFQIFSLESRIEILLSESDRMVKMHFIKNVEG